MIIFRRLELFVHCSSLEQAGLSELQEGTRIRIQVTDGKKRPQVSMIALA